MTDFRVLCTQLLAAVEHQHGDPSIDRLALSRRARAALAEGDGVGPTDEELDELYFDIDATYVQSWQPFARAVLERWGITHPRPIPVAERPWEREGFCDDERCCWAIGQREVWVRVYVPGRNWSIPAYTHVLPAAAIPLPEASP